MAFHSARQHVGGNSLSWLLKDLDLAGVKGSVLSSTDGLVMSWSESVSREDAEKISAAVSSQVSVGKALAQYVGGGVRQLLVECEGGFVLMSAATTNSVLLVLTDPTADIGAVTHRMNELAARVGRELAAGPRRVADDGPERS
ncbi:roadblock/LC7 domain-containing protein [Streptomyces sp. NPDC059076]|uniref:roadblock/LC7 domain-containing protein n=1 Tax=unclassified Streptomyces TaxID=2593676 RepID=UPI0036AC469E